MHGFAINKSFFKSAAKSPSNPGYINWDSFNLTDNKMLWEEETVLKASRILLFILSESLMINTLL